MKNTKLILSLILLASLKLFAHGENKPGPHGGFIKMPGAFHTEIVPNTDSSFKLYLLDINWKNPSVKDSSLNVLHKPSNSKAICKIEKNYYYCKLDKTIKLKNNGSLTVEAKREGQNGIAMEYMLPLKLETGMQDHSSHH